MTYWGMCPPSTQIHEDFDGRDTLMVPGHMGSVRRGSEEECMAQANLSFLICPKSQKHKPALSLGGKRLTSAMSLSQLRTSLPRWSC